MAATGHKALAEMSEILQEGFHGQEDGSSSNMFQGIGGATWRARKVRPKTEGWTIPSFSFTITHEAQVLQDTKCPSAPIHQASVLPCSIFLWQLSLGLQPPPDSSGLIPPIQPPQSLNQVKGSVSITCSATP